MKLTYLGTAAAEGFPAVFCNCAFCRMARNSGDQRNIRTRSQALINDDLLLDLPADTYAHFLNNNILGHKIQYLFITHSHGDHLYPLELYMRQGAFAHDMEVPVLKVYCSRGAYERIEHSVMKPEGFAVNLIKPFDKIKVGGYEITALPAKHAFGEEAVFYIIRDCEKTLLYAHDTGYFYDEVFEYIEKEQLYFDLISMDCTNVDIPEPDEGGHMGVDNIERVIARLSSIGAVKESTQIYINHFSHNANPLQEVLEQRVGPLGYKVAFDGLQVQL